MHGSDYDNLTPTDRSAAAAGVRAFLKGHRELSDADLVRMMSEAAREGRMDEARQYRRRFQEQRRVHRQADDERRATADRALGRMQAEAAQRGNKCDLTPQGCTCRGMLDYTHQHFLAELRKPAVSPETQTAVAGLLGYPPGGKRIKAIFGGTLGGGPTLPGFEWAAGAVEEDWLELLEIAQRAPGAAGGPLRNHRDGSIREGWVRAVLGSVMERHRAARKEHKEHKAHEEVQEMDQASVGDSGAEIH